MFNTTLNEAEMIELVATSPNFTYRNMAIALFMPLLLYSIWNFYEHRRRMRGLVC